MNAYEWIAEAREAVALKRNITTGETFEAPQEIGDQYVEQGLAKPLEHATEE